MPGHRKNNHKLVHLRDLIGLGPFLSLHDLKLNCVAFLERLEPIALDRRIMHKNVSPAVLSDKSVAFAIIEPFNFALKSCHVHPPSSDNIYDWPLAGRALK